MIPTTWAAARRPWLVRHDGARNQRIAAAPKWDIPGIVKVAGTAAWTTQARPAKKRAKANRKAAAVRAGKDMADRAALEHKHGHRRLPAV